MDFIGISVEIDLENGAHNTNGPTTLLLWARSKT